MSKNYRRDDPDEPPYYYATSYKFPDGRLAEMICNKDKNLSEFVINKSASGEKLEFEQHKSIKMSDGSRCIALEAGDPMIKMNFVKAPSKLEPYQDNKLLLQEIKDFIKRFVVLPPDFLDIAATYTMFTWIYDAFSVIPYLRVIGGPGTGKTRFLQTIGNLCYTPIFVGGSASAPAVFRTLDFIKGTLVFDEGDFKDSDLWTEIVKILNTGNDSTFPVIRVGKIDEHQFNTQAFGVFGPKVLATRERFADEALESRCLTQHLWPIQEIAAPIHITSNFQDEALALRNKLLYFRFKHFYSTKLDESLVEKIKIPRVKQTILALITTASLIDDSLLDPIIRFAQGLENDLQNQQRSTTKVDVLICLLEMLNSYEINHAWAKKIYVKAVADWYHKKFSLEHNDREPRHYKNENGELIVMPNYVVSARKTGTMIGKLGIKKDRDADGFYIPASEYERIKSLGNYYGITKDMLDIKKPDDDEQQPLPLEENS